MFDPIKLLFKNPKRTTAHVRAGKWGNGIGALLKRRLYSVTSKLVLSGLHSHICCFVHALKTPSPTPSPTHPPVSVEEVYRVLPASSGVEELGESGGGRPGLPVLMSFVVS